MSKVVTHSPLFNDFLSFYFETSVDDQTLYETIFDYSTMTWQTREIANPANILLSDVIHRTLSQKEEDFEIGRIKRVVTAHLIKT